MLKTLRKDLRATREGDFVTEAMSKSVTDDSIKNIFLNEKDGVVLGAENDKEIAALVAEIPEYGGDEDEEMEEDLENLVESFVPETVTEAAADDDATLRSRLAIYEKSLAKAKASSNPDDAIIRQLESQIRTTKQRISN